jgi:hypothetical protein
MRLIEGRDARTVQDGNMKYAKTYIEIDCPKYTGICYVTSFSQSETGKAIMHYKGWDPEAKGFILSKRIAWTSLRSINHNTPSPGYVNLQVESLFLSRMIRRRYKKGISPENFEIYRGGYKYNITGVNAQRLFHGLWEPDYLSFEDCFEAVSRDYLGKAFTKELCLHPNETNWKYPFILWRSRPIGWTYKQGESYRAAVLPDFSTLINKLEDFIEECHVV